MTNETKKKVRRALIAAALGAALALACKALPPDYQGPCEIVINVCTGGF